MPEVITRAEAKARGLKRYFTGKPCKRGHVAERNAGSKNCVECYQKWKREKRANDPEYVERERERAREWQREKRANDPEWAERRRELDREWQREKRANDPEWAERRRERDRERHRERREAGLCGHCGREPEFGLTHCTRCHQRFLWASAKRRANNPFAGMK